jgi:hypothetical protein
VSFGTDDAEGLCLWIARREPVILQQQPESRRKIFPWKIGPFLRKNDFRKVEGFSRIPERSKCSLIDGQCRVLVTAVHISDNLVDVFLHDTSGGRSCGTKRSEREFGVYAAEHKNIKIWLLCKKKPIEQTRTTN